MKVLIHLLHQSQPIERYAINCYTKDGLFCVLLDDDKVEKYPVQHLFRVTEIPEIKEETAN